MRDFEEHTERLLDERVREELARILASEFFKQARRQSRFLSYIVEESLAGRSGRLKGYNIGVEVFERDESFDPLSDSIVRVEAGRLRSKLREYYENNDDRGGVRIRLPKGAYAPKFELLDEASQNEASRRTFAGAVHRSRYSVAVLPLVNLSDDADQVYFVDGMTDALINRLARNAELSVTSFTSSMRFKNSRQSLPEIADRLKVEYVIEGTVLRVADRVRISAQLIHAANDRHVWAESYERKLTDVLAVQDEVAGNVSAALGAPGVFGPAHVHEKLNTAALEANFLGRRSRTQLTLDGLHTAIDYFENAIAVEPNYGEAYAGLAGCYCTLGTHGVELEAPHDIIPKGIDLAEKAIALDESFVEGRAFLGIMLLKYRWDWTGAERQFKRALEISPNDPRALMQYSMLLESTGQYADAVAYAERAQRIDPLSKPVGLNRGWQLHQAGEYEHARTVLFRLIELEPDFWGGYWGLGHVFRELEDYGRACSNFSRAVELQGEHNVSIEGLGHALALAGQAGQATELVTRLKEAGKRRYVSPCRIAAIYAGLGEADRMFEHLEQAYQARARSLAWLAVAKEYREYRDDPRFKALISKIGIPVKIDNI